MRDMKTFAIFLIALFLSIVFILSNCTVKDPIGPFLSNNVEDTENEINGDANGDTTDNGIDYIIQHDWETNEEGWNIDTGTAVTNVEQSTAQAKSNNSSLAIMVNLNTNNIDGIVSYYFCPSFIDLSTNKIHLWVFFPPGSEGDPSSLNRFQLVFRDTDFLDNYSHFMEIGSVDIITNQWHEIVINMTNENWAISAADLTILCGYGIKISHGPASAYSNSFTFYIDAYGWD